MAIKGKIKDFWIRVKDFFGKMSKKGRILIGAGAAGILLFAVVVTVLLNARATTYQVLYPNITAEESSEVYRELLAMGAQPKMNTESQILVPSEEYDIWLLALAAEGYPRTALTYGTYLDNSGMTTTETDRQKLDIFQLQDRIQGTLKQMNGVSSAVVTITEPKTSDYVWQQADNTERPTAAVLLTLKSDVTFSAAQVTTVKNLVARSVLNLQPADVTVVDAKTSLELTGEASEEEAGLGSNRALELEQMVQKQIESNIVRLLTPRYGAGGVVASAKVTLNFDKMMSEQLELQEKPENEDGTGGGGFQTEGSGHYGTGGTQPIGGIVGEEDNTDIPGYGYGPPANNDDATYYDWNVKYDYSYIKTQIEKGNAPIERATISVMVDEKSLTQARRAELTSLVSTGVDIDPELIFVSAFQPDLVIDDEPGTTAPEEPPVGILGFIATLPLWVILAAAGVLVILILLTIFLILRHRRKQRALERAKQAEEEAIRITAQEEIDNYKNQLSSAAKSGNNAKDEAILTEVRDFAKENPEITANLLRSWLRESE